MGNRVDDYLAAITNKDWAGLSSTLADVFERIGPYRDVVGSKDEYVKFLERVVTPLEEYQVRAVRVAPSESVVFAEVVESFVHGERMDVPEVLVFDLAPDGLISRVQVYMMHEGEPPVPGARA
jgi:hypothetical protein